MNINLIRTCGALGSMLAVLLALGAVEAFAADHREVAAKPVTSTPARMPKRATRKVLTLPPDAPRFTCEDGECTCSGVLDCKDLLGSGACKGKDMWEDSDDPSKGGCG